jgi:hypothetical protein
VRRLLILLALGGAAVYLWKLIAAHRVHPGPGWDLPPADANEPVEPDDEFLSILACPRDKRPVRREGDTLICSVCGARYPIRDGVPVMMTGA